MEMIGGSPFLAPIQSTTGVSKAVDIGCGTGVATIQIAGMLPSAKVYGLDISPVPEATQKKAPTNISWAVGNVLDVDINKPRDDVMSRQIFTPGELDYIFGRMLILGINDWPRYFSIASQSLKSGGIIEHQDVDWELYRVGTSHCLSDNWEWHRNTISGFEQAGFSPHAGSDAASHMKDAGLDVINVQTFEFSFVPSSKVPKSQAMGRYVQAQLVQNYPGMLRKLLSPWDFTSDELNRLTKDCLRDLASEEGLHYKYTVTIGRKP